ncbi:uncharacterized protein LOC134851852 [Symsagittifera roscoffensis]|uniref:uncharacterized protein LOC134851852 n=1 Tax=Symsagittifera roscoffensis TaxID=84072 RepID=UPI00307CA55E
MKLLQLIVSLAVMWHLAVCFRYPSADWESLVFRLPADNTFYGRKCKQHSRFYCLDKYETQFQPLLQFSGTPDRQDRQQTEEETLEVASEFEQLLRDKWSKINMVDQFRPSHCCDGQTGKYLFHGFSNLGMTPEQYMFKLTDYSEDNKPLNFISSFYVPTMCRNVVMAVGFGPGGLLREMNHDNGVAESAPYLIPGHEFHPSVAIPNIPSISFDYFDPGSQLTFQWFKTHIMCKDQHWICDLSVSRHTD